MASLFTIWNSRMTIVSLQASTLNSGTPSGLFVSTGGIRFWVTDSIPYRCAIQLDNCPEFPKFTSHCLYSVDAIGVWLGPVRATLGSPVAKSFRGRCGMFGKSGLRYFLKVLDIDGAAKRQVILPGDLGQPDRFTSYHPHWKLKLAVGPDAVCVFQSDREPPEIRRPEVVAARPRLVWSAPLPSDSDGVR